jgi:hypothetical protein
MKSIQRVMSFLRVYIHPFDGRKTSASGRREHVSTAGELLCLTGQHDLSNPQPEDWQAIGGIVLKQRRLARCQREGCTYGVIQVRERTSVDLNAAFGQWIDLLKADEDPEIERTSKDIPLLCVFNLHDFNDQEPVEVAHQELEFAAELSDSFQLYEQRRHCLRCNKSSIRYREGKNGQWIELYQNADPSTNQPESSHEL